MIRREQIIERLVDACPSYRTCWEIYRNSPEFDVELLYVQLGNFAEYIVDLLERGETVELPALARELERLHADGDDYVKEAATIGLLEAIQNIAGHRGVSTKRLEAALGLETRRAWTNLD